VNKPIPYSIAAGVVTLATIVWSPVPHAQANANAKKAFLEEAAPSVFQAAGPTLESIQSAVAQFRLAIGGDNNANNQGPIDTGRREINWDGGGNNTATSPGPTPFQVFLASRGADITTPGEGFVQATPSGLADTFSNAALTSIFQPFSQFRLFAPIGSNVTDVTFFIPGGGNIAAETSAFGVVFSDVDQEGSTRVKYFDAFGKLLYTVDAPHSPGLATFSFVAVQFPDSRIASVRIVTGNEVIKERKPKRDVVVMDDFIYAEPRITP
jgi:hypothetical protein